jgi:hypothetical protein
MHLDDEEQGAAALDDCGLGLGRRVEGALGGVFGEQGLGHSASSLAVKGSVAWQPGKS